MSTKAGEVQSSVEGRLDVADLLDEPSGLGDLAEPLVLVESHGGVVDCVDDYEPRGDPLCRGDDAFEGVGEQGAAETSAVE